MSTRLPQNRLMLILLTAIMCLLMLPNNVNAAGRNADPIRLTDGIRHEQGHSEKTAPTFTTYIDRDKLPESARNFTRIRVMSSDHPLDLDKTGVSPYTNWSDYYNNHFYNSMVPFEGRWGVLTILYDDKENALAYHYTDIDLTLSDGGGQPSDGNDGNGGNVPTGKIDHLELSERELNLSAGQTAKLKVYAIYSNGADKEITNDKKTGYRTDGASIANVAAGVVKAGKKEGTATITVSYGDKKVTVPVHVSAAQISQLKSSLQEVTMETGELQQVRLTAIFSNGTVKDVTGLALWTTDDSATADVDGGEIEAQQAGDTVVTAYYGGFNVNVSVEVVDAGGNAGSLNEVAGLEASNKNIKMKPGDEKTLEIYAVYDDGSKEDVTGDVLWQTSKSDVADAEDGIITAAGPGKAIITANYGNVNLQITVQVEKEKTVKALKANVKTVTLARGGDKDVTLTAVYADGSTSDVTERAEWTSKNDKIADVDAGLITANRRGSIVITAKYNGKLVNIEVKVK